MATLPVPNCASVVINQRIAAQEVKNVLHVTFTGGVSYAGLLAVADLVRDRWISTILTDVSNQVELLSVTATDLSVLGGEQYLSTAPPNTRGHVGLPALPNNVALCVTAQTARTGRSYRGRIYLAGLPTDAISESFFLAARANAFVTALNSLRLAFGSLEGGAALVIVSRFNNKAQRNPPVTTPVTEFRLVDYAADSQRRRLPGRGK